MEFLGPLGEFPRSLDSDTLSLWILSHEDWPHAEGRSDGNTGRGAVIHIYIYIYKVHIDKHLSLSIYVYIQ